MLKVALLQSWNNCEPSKGLEGCNDDGDDNGSVLAIFGLFCVGAYVAMVFLVMVT